MGRPPYVLISDGSASGVYRAPLILRQTERIKFFYVDNAGNRERVQTVTVRVG